MTNEPLRRVNALLAVVVVAAAAGVSCASSQPEADDLDALVEPQQTEPVVQALPTRLDAVVRVPLAEAGEPIARAFFEHESFDPHRDGYGPPDREFAPHAVDEVFDPTANHQYTAPRPEEVDEGPDYACSEHQDVRTNWGGECPHCGREFVPVDELDVEAEEPAEQPLVVEREDWVRWPDSLGELGARATLSALLQGIEHDSLSDQIRNAARRSPLPPLEIEEITGPALVGYSVDDRTRELLDFGDPAGPGQFDDGDPWFPHVRVTLAVPTADAAEQVERYELFCLDDRHEVCDRIVDVRADRGVLVVEMVEGVDDEQLARIGDRIREGPNPRSELGVADRLGLEHPTTALATFWREEGPGYYARVDGLRRLAGAEYLADEYDVQDDDYERLVTVMRAVRTRVYADTHPRRDDVGAVADIGDGGVIVESLSSRTDRDDSREADDSKPLPAPEISGVESVWSTVRLETTVDDSEGEETGWEPVSGGLEDDAEWLQGAVFALLARPVGRQPGQTVREGGFGTLFDELRAVGPDGLGDLEELILDAVYLAQPDGMETADAEGMSDVVDMLADHAPDSVGMTIGEVHVGGIEDENSPVGALGLYWEDSSMPDVLEPVVEYFAQRARGQGSRVDVDAALEETGERTSLYLTFGISADRVAGEPRFGPAGGSFEWSGMSPAHRSDLDSAFGEMFPGLLPPDRITWEPTSNPSATGTRIELGRPEAGIERVEAPAAPVDEARICVGGVQADIAGLFDVAELRDSVPDHPHAQRRRQNRQSRAFRQAFVEEEYEGHWLPGGLDLVEDPVLEALTAARHRVELEANLENVVEGLNGCADDHPDSAAGFESAAEGWKRWGEQFAD